MRFGVPKIELCSVGVPKEALGSAGHQKNTKKGLFIYFFRDSGEAPVLSKSLPLTVSPGRHPKSVKKDPGRTIGPQKHPAF